MVETVGGRGRSFSVQEPQDFANVQLSPSSIPQPRGSVRLHLVTLLDRKSVV